MIELPLVFLGGLLGSAHCVGMCGGIALVVGSASRGLAANFGRQALYSLGRIFTYATFGAVGGYAGLRVSEDVSRLVNLQSLLAIAAGALLVGQGLIATGLLRRAMFPALIPAPGGLAVIGNDRSPVGCLAGGLVGSLLRSRSLSSVFLAGVFTGFLPCGLVYAYLALAASASDPLRGAVTMAAFGAGTVPAMLLTGGGATLLSRLGRQRMLRAAAWCVIGVGVISLARGLGFLESPIWRGGGTCPACADRLHRSRASLAIDSLEPNP
jgi:sulfite exporter TauE/SafE